jgi:translation elongation factor EF-Ts
MISPAHKSPEPRGSGAVTSYIHPGGRIGVLVEVVCESDFVARTDEFQTRLHDLAMHIAASNPQFIRKEMSHRKQSSANETFTGLKPKQPASRQRWSRRSSKAR